MSDTRLRQLSLPNLLSFGPDSEPVELRDLNVLIGPNTSGKSNFVDALALLGTLPTDLSVPIREGGGIHEWLWRGGERKRGKAVVGRIDAILSRDEACDVRHWVDLGADGSHVCVLDERIEPFGLAFDIDPEVYYTHAEGERRIFSQVANRMLRVKNLSDAQSILARSNDPEAYPTLAALRDLYQGIRVYRDWDTSRGGVLRSPQPADLPEDFLLPDAKNLGVVLNNLQRHTDAWEALHHHLARLHPSLKEIRTLVQANTVQIMLREQDLKTLTPATRLSDGTLRYLALLAVLLHPEPPTLIAIEEPELGLHPDLIEDLAKLLVDASSRAQVVVTTHSDHLVNALSSDPSSVVVVEREPGGTVMRRLDAERLSGWLEKYRLGELWMKGEIGGTRW